MTSRRGLLVLAVLVAGVLLLPTPVHAERLVTQDPSGDAQAFVFEHEAQFVAMPNETTIDIIRTVAALGHRRLNITVHFRDLQVRPRHETFVRVRTPRGTFDVSAERLSARGPQVAVTRRYGEAFGCRGLRVSYDGGAELLSLAVPTSCIGAPRWVVLGVRASGTPEADAENPSTVILLADDGHRDTFRDISIGKGPRIHRG